MTNRAALLGGVRASVAVAVVASCLQACPKPDAHPIAGSVDAATDATAIPSATITAAPALSAAPVPAPVATDGGQEASAAATLPCSGAGYGPGPELAAAKGLPSFAVPFNCLWPSHQRLEISLSLLHRATRSQVEALLRALWTTLKTSMGSAFPETVKLCVLPPGKSFLDSTPLGCMRKGYEPEGEPGEEEADLRIDMPPEPAELAAFLGTSFGKRFVGTHRPRVTFDDARGELSMVYPYVDDGTDRWATQPSYVDVTLPFFVLAWEFYPPKTALSALAYQGIWKGKTVMRVRLADLKAFLSMDPWGVRDRLGAAHVPLEPGAARTAEQTATLRKELESALAKLPPGSVIQSPPAP